jgi:hypothetical protein
VPDLMAALEASIAAAKGPSESGAKKKRSRDGSNGSKSSRKKTAAKK